MARKMFHIIFKCNVLIRITIFLVFAYLLVPGSASAGENSLLELENGLEIHLYAPDDVMALTARDSEGRLALRLPSGLTYRLIDDILDPEITNRGDGAFHPMSADWVIEALSKIDVSGERISLPVNVYVLPLPRSGFLASSSSGYDIFLSPGVYDVGRCAVACTATHELGHVFQHHFVPERGDDDWPRYLELRGIEDEEVYSASGPHMNRPIEIFAEDFRYLFGGSEACYSGTIENPDLPEPDRVESLEEYFVALATPVEIAAETPSSVGGLRLANYPNPFNPSTTIRIERAGGAPVDGADVEVSIYRVDGSLVTRLYEGRFAGTELSIPWNGTDSRGRALPSGVYLYSVRSAGLSASGKMLLAR